MDFVAAEDVAEGVHYHAVLFEARFASKAGGADVGAVVDAVEGVQVDFGVGEDGFDA